MTATAVPLRPVSKSALWTLILGLVVLVAAAGGLAYATTSGFDAVEVETIAPGTGPSPAADDFVLVNYKGMLEDGTVFDEGQQTPFDLGAMIPGFSEGVQQMKAGGTYRVTIPSRLAYGDEDKSDPATGELVIPGGSDLVFEVELLEMKSRAEVMAIQQQMQMMQQQMQQQQMQGGEAPPQPGE